MLSTGQKQGVTEHGRVVYLLHTALYILLRYVYKIRVVFKTTSTKEGIKWSTSPLVSKYLPSLTSLGNAIIKGI